jgi:hypothetical protein
MVDNGILKLENNEVAKEIIENNYELNDEEKSTLISFKEDVEYSRTKSSNGNTDSELTDLIPNENLLSLLNSNNKIIVGDFLYKITKEGTYYCDAKYGNLIDSLINDKINSKTKTAERSRHNLRFEDSFRREDNDSEINYGSVNIANSYGNNSSYQKDILKNLKEVKFDAKTWAGKAIQSLFKRYKKHNVYFNSKRRVQVNFYDYNLVFYGSAGVYAKFQRRNWYRGWQKTESENLIIGWNNVHFKRKLSDGMRNYAQWKRQNITKPHILSQSNGDKWLIIERSISDWKKDLSWFEKIENEAIAKGAKTAYDLLKRRLGSEIPYNQDYQKIILRAYDIAHNEEHYFISANFKENKNGRSVKKTFFSSPSFVVGWSNQKEKFGGFNIKPSEKGWDLVSGNCFGMAYYHQEWKGVKIVLE